MNNEVKPTDHNADINIITIYILKIRQIVRKDRCMKDIYFDLFTVCIQFKTIYWCSYVFAFVFSYTMPGNENIEEVKHDTQLYLLLFSTE